MERLSVECLCCGQLRIVAPRPRSRVGDPGECPACGYLGWARASELTDESRRVLQGRPPARRRANAA